MPPRGELAGATGSRARVRSGYWFYTGISGTARPPPRSPESRSARMPEVPALPPLNGGGGRSWLTLSRDRIRSNKARPRWVVPQPERAWRRADHPHLYGRRSMCTRSCRPHKTAVLRSGLSKGRIRSVTSAGPWPRFLAGLPPALGPTRAGVLRVVKALRLGRYLDESSVTAQRTWRLAPRARPGTDHAAWRVAVGGRQSMDIAADVPRLSRRTSQAGVHWPPRMMVRPSISDRLLHARVVRCCTSSCRGSHPVLAA